MKIATIVGARPQFIKAAPLSKALRVAGHQEILVHTGQHYDYGMSQIFFEELGLPLPDINLGVGSGSHGWQTGQMIIGIERELQALHPDWVLIYGDTNSTLAAALTAVKLRIPIVHIEAGLRSFNREMPEEHNRVLADHCSDLLCCPTITAVNNLRREGISHGVYLVGDTMYDAVLQYAGIARRQSLVLANLHLEPKAYMLVTIHRQSNVDNSETLTSILRGLQETGEPIVFPVHPRTRRKMVELGLLSGNDDSISNLKLIEPVGYLDMLMLQQNARMVLTDSGGMQKEAYFLGVPCVTLRSETEWPETVEAGWNVLVGSDSSEIVKEINKDRYRAQKRDRFGDGCAANNIVNVLEGKKVLD